MSRFNQKNVFGAVGAALAVASVAIVVSSQASAAAYDATKSYAAGAQVTFNGQTYRAKWWANPGQSPADIGKVANAWDTPWEQVKTTGGTANAAPTVRLTAPTAGASLAAGASLLIVADAADSDGQVAKVEFFAGNALLGTVTAAPYRLTATGLAAGTHSITAVATDNGGKRTVSGAVAISVVGASVAPSPGDSYDPSASYGAGCVVQYQGKFYRAKWYANPGQSPAQVATAANAWDTPWEPSSAASSSCGGSGSTGPTTPTDPTPPTSPPTAPGTGSGTPVKLLQSKLNADETRLTSDPLMQKVKASIRTLDNAQVEAVAPGRAQNPENVKRVESLLSNAQFEYLFPMRAPEYTYRGLLQAFAKFPAICATYTDRDSDAVCRKTLATMFAHFAQETGGHESWRAIPEWRQALVHVREMGWNETMRGGYNGECNPKVWQGQAWPCGKFEDGTFKSYFGRGAKQLSYNYNYGPFSEAMFGTVRTLLDKPELVADTWLNLASATFFFSYPQPPKPSMLHVIDGTWQPNARDVANGLVPGFGVTTQIINGGVECGGPTENAQSLNRIKYYREFAAYFNVSVPGNEVLGCKGMKVFDEGGAGALPVYWEQDYSWSNQYADGKSYACKLVGYQTAFSAFKQGDYTLCVAANFPNAEVVNDVK